MLFVTKKVFVVKDKAWFRDGTAIFYSDAEWRRGEESRRQAVEEVLEQLLARDCQYRKELHCHMENRQEMAKKRRSHHRQQYREVRICSGHWGTLQ